MMVKQMFWHMGRVDWEEGVVRFECKVKKRGEEEGSGPLRSRYAIALQQQEGTDTAVMTFWIWRNRLPVLQVSAHASTQFCSYSRKIKTNRSVHPSSDVNRSIKGANTRISQNGVYIRYIWQCIMSRITNVWNAVFFLLELFNSLRFLQRCWLT
jgi:hypothetical protein